MGEAFQCFFVTLLNSDYVERLNYDSSSAIRNKGFHISLTANGQTLKLPIGGCH
jgi:hypothetical protein